MLVMPREGAADFVIGVDINFALQPGMDRSTGIDTSHTQQERSCYSILNNLIDIWRARHPDQQIVSYYPSTCQTFSRIDYYTVSQYWYDSIVISDHALVSFIMNITQSLNYSPDDKLHKL